MKKTLSFSLIVALLAALTSFSFKHLPLEDKEGDSRRIGISVNIQNTTSGTVTIGLSYYDASNNFLGSGSHAVTAGSSATDSQTFTTTAKVVVSVVSGSCKTLDFWDSSYTFSGGCNSNVNGVTGGTFVTSSSYGSYVLLVNNGGCR